MRSQKADTYFVVNQDDKALKPIYISLPKPPSSELIDGHSLDHVDQFFRRHVMPEKLVNLEKRVYRELKDSWEENKNRTITGARIINRFWDIIDDESEYYENEIKWMQKVIWHTIHGYWFFNNGKPTFLPPFQYELLNFWFNPDIPGGYFEYRDRDRRKLLFDYYAYTATETFKKLDADGNAVKTGNKYEMVDLNRRIAYGTIKPKNRRSGETHQGLCQNWAIIRKSVGGNATIVSKTGNDTVKYWNEKFMPAWRNYPLFLKPIWNGSNNPGNLDLRPPNNDFVSPTLDSQFYPTESADEIALDGGKYYAILLDEQAKVATKGAKVDVMKRFEVNKLTMSQGLNIHGFCTNPSTVEEMNAGGEIYYEMCSQSDFYNRLPSGQTKSGILLQYSPAQDGWEGFITPYGASIIEDPKWGDIKYTEQYCRKYNIPKTRFTYLDGRGARRTLQEERDALLKEGTPRAKIKYRAMVRKQPMSYDDCWSGTSGDLGLDVESVQAQMAILRRNRRRTERYGFFRWKYGPDSEVEWVDDVDGPWVRVEDIPFEIRNQKIRTRVENFVTGQYEDSYAPRYASKYILGCDPFGYHDELLETRGTSKSKGGAGLLKEMIESDKGKNIEDYEGFRFTMSYLGDSTQYEFDEQMLMCCVYSGAGLFLERNKESTWKHFNDRGYRGYLRYEWDSVKQCYKDRPGYYLTDKTELFKGLEFYINHRVHKEEIYEFLKDMTEIRDVKQLTKYDRLAGHLAALRGSQSKHGVYVDRFSNNKLDISKIIDISLI